MSASGRAALKAVELMQQGMSDEEIAALLNRSVEWIAFIRRNTVIREEPGF